MAENDNSELIRHLRDQVDSANKEAKEARIEITRLAAELKDATTTVSAMTPLQAEMDTMKARLSVLEPIEQQFESQSAILLGINEKFKADYESSLLKVPDAHRQTIEKLSSTGDYMDRLNSLQAALSILPTVPSTAGPNASPGPIPTASAAPTDGAKVKADPVPFDVAKTSWGSLLDGILPKNTSTSVFDPNET